MMRFDAGVECWEGAQMRSQQRTQRDTEKSRFLGGYRRLRNDKGMGAGCFGFTPLDLKPAVLRWGLRDPPDEG